MRFEGPAPAGAADRAMAKLAERYLDFALRFDPVRASAVGYHKWDGLLPDYSKEQLARAMTTVAGFRRELERIDPATLSPAWAVDRELVLDHTAELAFTFGELEEQSWNVQLYNQAIGGGLYHLTVPPADPAEWPQRLEALLSRLAALPALVRVAERELKSPPKIFTDFVVEQNPGNIEVVDKQLPPLFQPYPALKARFDREQPKAVEALKHFQRFLETELAARSTGSWRLGRERYARKLELVLGSKLSPEELAQSAQAALESTRFEMYDVALPLFRQLEPKDDSYRRLAGDARINRVVGRVIAEAAKDHGTAESLFADVQGHVERIKGFIERKQIIGLPPPSDNFVVERTPPFLDGLAVAFFNAAPAFEPGLKKSFWISTVPKDAESFLREYNNHMLQALTIHEAFPGHYVQSYWSTQGAMRSITKQVFESSTMAEGWACMIEELMHAQGYADADPKARLFHLKMKLRLFVNALIDSGLHAGGEDEAAADRRALALMRDKGFQEEAEATRKLRRAKLTSAQLSTYFVGYQEMRAIYADGRAKAGERFDSKAFLEKMLSYGTIPPAMIRRLLAADGLL